LKIGVLDLLTLSKIYLCLFLLSYFDNTIIPLKLKNLFKKISKPDLIILGKVFNWFFSIWKIIHDFIDVHEELPEQLFKCLQLTKIIVIMNNISHVAHQIMLISPSDELWNHIWIDLKKQFQDHKRSLVLWKNLI